MKTGQNAFIEQSIPLYLLCAENLNKSSNETNIKVWKNPDKEKIIERIIDGIY
ncbi:hypothetical protein ACVXZ0_17080 [Staphylococcus aureus]